MRGCAKLIAGWGLLLSLDAAAWESEPLPEWIHNRQHSESPSPPPPNGNARPLKKNFRKDDLPTDYLRQLQAAMAHAEAQEYPQTERTLSQVIDQPLFRRLPRANQYAALTTAGWAAVQLKQYQRARQRYRDAVAIEPGQPDAWYYLSQLERLLGDSEAAARHLLHLSDTWPQTLNGLDDVFIVQLQNDLEPTSPLRAELLQSLFDARWDRKQLGADNLWYELALIRIRDGDTESARAAIARIAGPVELAKLRSDNRFDALVDPQAPAFDVEEAALRRVENLRRLTLERPRELQLLADLGSAMLTAGLHQEVLDLTGKTLSAIRDAPPDDAPFDDMETQVWIMNDRAIALRRLGRIEEAVAELERASKLSEQNQTNVSQALNLGQFYCSLGRPDDALAAIATLGQMSGFGRMVQASVQQRAALQKGDHAAAAQALAYIRKHRKQSQATWLEALVEADRMEEAERTLIDLLKSPAERADALSWLQQFALSDPLPGSAAARARWERLADRPKVREAVARVGRVQRYDIYRDYSTE